MLSDPIADMLTRIRNAVRVDLPHVDMPTSKIKRGVADVLKREGFIWDWQEVQDESSPVPQLRIVLKYVNGQGLIQSIRRISKPGRRVYMKASELRPILNGLGIRILSTSRGIMSDREARRRKIGGEVLAEVY